MNRLSGVLTGCSFSIQLCTLLNSLEVGRFIPVIPRAASRSLAVVMLVSHVHFPERSLLLDGTYSIAAMSFRCQQEAYCALLQSFA